MVLEKVLMICFNKGKVMGSCEFVIDGFSLE